MSAHRFSGWPGAWCLDCGCDDPIEMAIARGDTDDDGRVLLGALSDAEKAPCPEPGSGRFDPYRGRGA